MIPTMHDTLLHIHLHKKNNPATYLLLHQNAILLYMENLHETKNPTIYSIVSTNHYIVKLSYVF